MQIRGGHRCNKVLLTIVMFFNVVQDIFLQESPDDSFDDFFITSDGFFFTFGDCFITSGEEEVREVWVAHKPVIKGGCGPGSPSSLDHLRATSWGVIIFSE